MTILPNDHTVRDDMNCGAIIGRADLSDDVLAEALRERLTSFNRPGSEAETVMASALSGNPEAVSLLRTVQVPAPQMRLSMPTQSLTRNPQGRKFSVPFLRFSWGRS